VDDEEAVVGRLLPEDDGAAGERRGDRLGAEEKDAGRREQPSRSDGEPERKPLARHRARSSRRPGPGRLLDFARTGRRGRHATGTDRGPGVARGPVRLFGTFVLCVVVGPLGFLPTSIVFLALMMLLMGNRKPLQILVAPPLVTLVIWLIFEKALNLSMPVGVFATLADYL